MANTAKVNIRAVAANAGVSPATVSRVLNGNPSVDQNLVQRVLSAARELGYRGTVSSRGRGTIVFIVPGLGNTYYCNVASGAVDAARKLGYRVVIQVSDFNSDQELECLKAACTSDTVGIVFTPVAGRNPYEAVPALQGIPVVITGVRHLADNYIHIYLNNENSAYLSTHYLLRLGRKRIVFICHFWSDRIHNYDDFLAEYHSPDRSRYSVYDRYDGYCRALAEFGLSPSPELIAFGDFSYASGYQCASQLLASSVSFDAVIAPNDRNGAGFLNLLREQGFQVPQQVSLVCLNGGLISEVVSPALTSVTSKDYEMGLAAVEQLDNLIHGRPASSVKIDTQLMIKNSTQAAMF